MFNQLGVIERSLVGYPGHISAIIGIDSKTELSELKEGLLNDNPMLTALFFDISNIENCKDMMEWGKKNNLKIGLNTNKLNFEGLKSAIDSGFVDFVRVPIENTKDIKNKIGMIRSSGLKHEYIFKIGKNNLKTIEDVYKLVSPCDSFVVEIDSKISSKVKNSLVEMASKYKSIFLRSA